MNTETLFCRSGLSGLGFGYGAACLIAVADVAPFEAGLATCILTTRVATQALSLILTDTEVITTPSQFIAFEMTSALVFATITTVALAALSGLPILSLATLTLISVSVIPSWIDTLLTADYLSYEGKYPDTWTEYLFGAKI